MSLSRRITVVEKTWLHSLLFCYSTEPEGARTLTFCPRLRGEIGVSNAEPEQFKEPLPYEPILLVGNLRNKGGAEHGDGLGSRLEHVSDALKRFGLFI